MHSRGSPQALSVEGHHQELISRVQRSFRANRLQIPHSATSRRRAALAIERFYLKRRPQPYLSPNARAAASALLRDDDDPATGNLLASGGLLSSAAALGALPEQLQLIRSTQASGDQGRSGEVGGGPTTHPRAHTANTHTHTHTYRDG